MRISRTGRITVFTGASAMGQGLATAMAQIAASQLGVEVGKVQVVAGDTAGVSLGLGGFASRQTVTAGSSVLLAAKAVADKAKKVASHMLEAAEHDLELADGEVRVVGAPQLAVKLGEIARILQGAPGYGFPPGVDPGLEANVNFRTDSLCLCQRLPGRRGRGRYRDRRRALPCATSRSRIPAGASIRSSSTARSTAASPTASATRLFEWMGYDAAGQPITTTFADYLLTTATEVPRLETLYQESPSPHNPLGVKGVGEVGVIPAAAAIISAIEDALEPFGVRISQMPITPHKLVELIAAGRAAR